MTPDQIKQLTPDGYGGDFEITVQSASDINVPRKHIMDYSGNDMYNQHMTVDGHIEKRANDKDEKIETLNVEFTNGSLKQLRELAKFFDVKNEDPTEIVKLGISFMQNVKDRHDKEETES